LETANFLDSTDQQTSNTVSSRFIYRLTQGEEEVIPTQRVVSGQLLMEVPQDVIGPGFYELHRTEESQGTGQAGSNMMTLSFNINENESLVDQYQSDDLRSIFEGFPNVTIYEAQDVEEFAGLIRSEQTNIALWKYCLLIALFFLLTEILLIRFL